MQLFFVNNMNPDTNIQIIRNVVLKHLPGSTIKLFGSRAGNAHCDASDYDIMVIVPQSLSQEQISSCKSKIRKELAIYLIPIDVIVVLKEQLPAISQLTNHIVHEAMAGGFTI